MSTIRHGEETFPLERDKFMNDAHDRDVASKRVDAEDARNRRDNEHEDRVTKQKKDIDDNRDSDMNVEKQRSQQSEHDKRLSGADPEKKRRVAPKEQVDKDDDLNVKEVNIHNETERSKQQKGRLE